MQMRANSHHHLQPCTLRSCTTKIGFHTVSHRDFSRGITIARCPWLWALDIFAELCRSASRHSKVGMNRTLNVQHALPISDFCTAHSFENLLISGQRYRLFHSMSSALCECLRDINMIGVHIVLCSGKEFHPSIFSLDPVFSKLLPYGLAKMGRIRRVMCVSVGAEVSCSPESIDRSLSVRVFF